MSIFIKQWIGSPSSSVCAVLISFALYSKKACSLIKPFDAFDFATGLFRALYASPKFVPEKPPSFGIYTCVNGSLSKEHILGSEETLFPDPQATNIAKPELATRKQISLSTISSVNQRLLVITGQRLTRQSLQRLLSGSH
jgi:hypothetical protein